MYLFLLKIIGLLCKIFLNISLHQVLPTKKGFLQLTKKQAKNASTSKDSVQALINNQAAIWHYHIKVRYPHFPGRPAVKWLGKQAAEPKVPGSNPG